MDLKHIRSDYVRNQQQDFTLPDDPWSVFENWMKEALSNHATHEATAMILSTVSAKGQPSSRVVLLKEYQQGRFTFFTNYSSRKGEELDHNPMAALLFFWPALERQIRIEGRVVKTRKSESEKYFQSRPQGSKVAAIVSKQSKILDYKETLISQFDVLMRSDNLKCPRHWGGYSLIPSYFEFWQGGKDRLHDRIFFRKKGNKFESGRLYP